jgi:hypothetical protein
MVQNETIVDNVLANVDNDEKKGQKMRNMTNYQQPPGGAAMTSR